MKKKFLSFSLAFILLLNLLSAGVLAAEDTSPPDILAAVQSVVSEEESTLSAEEPAPVPEEEPIPEPEAEVPAPEPAEEIPAPAPEENDRTAPAPETEIFTAQHAAVNPLYADVIDIEDLCVSSEAPQLSSSGNTYSSIADAAAYMREQMVSRAATISFTLLFSSEVDLDALCDQLFTMALAHTGVSTEGDYLLSHYGGYDLSCTGYWEPSGDVRYVLSFSILYLSTAAQEAQVDTMVAQILKTRNLPRSSDYDTVKAVYDHLCENVRYDYANLNNSNYHLKHSAYAALIDGYAVCQGYAAALYRLLLECGIDCRVIFGIGNGGPHAWNIVQMDSRYYCSDATWDASRWEEGLDYDYFLAGGDGFHADHTPTLFNDEDYSLGSAFWNNYPLSATGYVPSGTGTGGSGGLSITTAFPDEAFRTYVKINFDTNGDNCLSESEIAAVTEIYVPELGISDLTGIEHFAELEYLTCFQNNLTELDVSQNTNLYYLWCSDNALEALDVSQNTDLMYLYCDYNGLTGLDVSKNLSLVELDCAGNLLTELDVANNDWLEHLDCYFNLIGELDVSQNDWLEYLDCGYNQIGELDVSNTPLLTDLYCDYNQLTSLDVSNNPCLQSLYCHGNSVDALDISGNTYLKYVYSLGERSTLETGDLFYEYILEGEYEDIYLSLCVDDGTVVCTERSPGDVNGNLILEPTDLVHLMKHILDPDGNPLASGTGDVNDDGEIDILDVIRLLGMLAG